MLINSLYTIKDISYLENNTLLAEILLNKDHEIFKGHFPNHPIVPGVCLTNMITDVISTSKQKEFYLKAAAFIKFISLVQPNTNLELSIRILISSENEQSVSADAVLFKENTVFLKFKGTFELIP